MRIVLCEDEAGFAAELKQEIEAFFGEHGTGCDIIHCGSGSCSGKSESCWA